MIIDEATYLEHHGVKGMKWGVRRKTNANRRVDKEEQRKFALGLRAKTDPSGLSRRDRGQLRVIDKRIEEAKRLRDHEGLRLQANTAVERMIFGENLFRDMKDTQIAGHQARQQRIRDGEKTLLDKLDGAMNVPLATLYFERR